MSRPLINTSELRRARAALGLSQAALARRVGVSQGLIWAIENGRKTPSLSVLVKLSMVLSLPLDALIYTGEVADSRITRSREKALAEPKRPCKGFRLSSASQRRLQELADWLREESARARECLRYLPKISFPRLRSSEVRAHE